MFGYAHPAYAQSLSEYGVPLELPQSGGWLIKRQIPHTNFSDAMGCYPLFACQNWSGLKADLEQVANDLISVSLVTDPFGDFDISLLDECFPDVMKLFKQHLVVDLEQPLESFVHPHHLRNARKAQQKVEITTCTEPIEFLEDWTSLYHTLTDRHHITGIAAFSKESFARQLRVPGIVAFRATERGTTAGMLLFYEQGNRAYYHLGAYSERGYELGSSFALFDHAIRYFCSRRFKWLNLGAGAGTGNIDSGLTRFKRGWSNAVRPAYFCGKIFAPAEYQQLVRAPNTHATDYFPAYRRGEFQ
jgi:hypothetical protein